MTKKKITMLVGSLRKDSFNKKIANEVMKIASSNLQLEILEIDQLNFYNENLNQKNPPQK